MMLSEFLYTSRMKERIEGKEVDLPLFLDHKVDANAFFVSAGIPAPKIFSIFDHPKDISIDDLPDTFVIKPSYASSSKGVHVIERDADGLFDRMSNARITLGDIIAVQTELYDKHDGITRRLTVAEELVEDVNAIAVPVDYKFMAFQGQIGLIIKVNRIGKKMTMSFYDGSFRPISDESVIPNRFYSDVVADQTPDNWRELLALASRVSTIVSTPFARVDLYDSTRGPLVGEITLTPSSFYFHYDHQLSLELNLRMGLFWKDAEKILGI